MTVVIPMREITVVEKANNPTLPNAVHITTKSKVSLVLVAQVSSLSSTFDSYNIQLSVILTITFHLQFDSTKHCRFSSSTTRS